MQGWKEGWMEEKRNKIKGVGSGMTQIRKKEKKQAGKERKTFGPNSWKRKEG